MDVVVIFCLCLPLLPAISTCLCQKTYTNLSVTACSIDIAIGFDISRRRNPNEVLVSGHNKLRTFLPEIANYVSSVQGLCCLGPEPIKPNVAYRIVSRDGNTVEDFSFSEYSNNVVTKVMDFNLAEPTYFNTALLRSFGEKFKLQSNAGVKVRPSTFMYKKVLCIIVLGSPSF